MRREIERDAWAKAEEIARAAMLEATVIVVFAWQRRLTGPLSGIGEHDLFEVDEVRAKAPGMAFSSTFGARLATAGHDDRGPFVQFYDRSEGLVDLVRLGGIASWQELLAGAELALRSAGRLLPGQTCMRIGGAP